MISQTSRTPEERAGFGRSSELEITANGSDCIHSFFASSVPCDHHVEVDEVRLFQAFIELFDLFCRHFSAFHLLVCSVVAY